MRIRKFTSPAPPAVSDDHAHGAQRHRRALITGSVATVARAVQIGSSLITIPLTLKYLGNERFGLWMTISSVLAMASFADFGVGNGVLNTVATAYGKDDIEGIRKAVSSGFAILTLIALLLLAAFAIVFPFVDWGNFFRVASSQARIEAGPALAVFVVCFALNISMDVVQRVQLGLQQGYRYSLWQLCGSIIGFAGIVVGIRLHLSLPLLVAAIAGAPIIATTLNTIHFFGFVRPDLRPSKKSISRDVISQITKLGGLFFVLQIVATISGSADNFIIARSLGAVNVPDYSIPQRMFGLVGMTLSMLIAPLWPAYSEAISRKHLVWVRRTFYRSILGVGTISLVAAVLLLLLAPHLIHWWVGSQVHPPFLLLLSLAIWTVLECESFTVGAFLNGAAAVKFQIYLAMVFGVCCIFLKLILITRLGVAALPLSSSVCCLLLQLGPWIVFIPRFIRELDSKSNSSHSPSEEIALVDPRRSDEEFESLVRDKTRR